MQTSVVTEVALQKVPEASSEHSSYYDEAKLIDEIILLVNRFQTHFN
jgi:hypothetical protein